MRVVVIGGWAPSLVKFRAPLLAAMVARGHDVLALAADGTPEVVRQLAALGVRFEVIPLERAGMDPIADLRLSAHLARRLRGFAPDVVFSYTMKPVIYGTLGAAIAGVPRRTAMITGLGYAFQGASTVRRRIVGGIARRLLRLALGQAHAVVFQNPDNRAELARVGALPAGVEVHVVRGSGVDLHAFAPAVMPEGPPTFLFMGRLLRDKGLLELVEAARQVRAVHPTARVQLLGWIDPNPESVTRAQVDAWVREGCVEYLGTADDVRPHLAAAHALVFPSHHEGTPRAVLEAMSMQRAVITTDAPGCRETIVPGESGLLVPVGDAPALAAAMRRLIEDPALLGFLAGNARRRAEALYDAAAVAAQMLEIMRL
jgi:glycosyltransferase involved in cell wall biosynthesis